MPKKVASLQQKNYFVIPASKLRTSFLKKECLVWVNISAEDSENTVDSTIEDHILYW